MAGLGGEGASPGLRQGWGWAWVVTISLAWPSNPHSITPAGWLNFKLTGNYKQGTWQLAAVLWEWGLRSSICIFQNVFYWLPTGVTAAALPWQTNAKTFDFPANGEP